MSTLLINSANQGSQLDLLSIVTTHIIIKTDILQISRRYEVVWNAYDCGQLCNLNGVRHLLGGGYQLLHKKGGDIYFNKKQKVLIFVYTHICISLISSIYLNIKSETECSEWIRAGISCYSCFTKLKGDISLTHEF